MTRSAFLASAAALAAVFVGAAAPPPPATSDFVQAAAESDQFEILAGRIAAVEGRDPRVRAFARQMIQDHAGTTQALRQAAEASGLPPPPMAVGGDQQRMLGALQSLTGPDFDTAYLRQQVLAHEAALTVEQAYAAGGGDPGVRRAARSAVPIVEHHLDMARRLRAAIGAPA